jgi:hypothetical protein
MIGGGGERKTLLLVARYADACNVFARSLDEVAHKLAVLREHCDNEGRDFDAITKTVMYSRPVLEDVNGFIAEAEEYAKLDIDEIQVLPDRNPVTFIEQVVEHIVPRVATIG